MKYGIYLPNFGPYGNVPIIAISFNLNDDKEISDGTK